MPKRGFFWSAALALCATLLMATLAACNHGGDFPPPPPTVPVNTLRVHYHRNDAAYAGWGIWDWLATGVTAGPVSNTGTWPTPNYTFTTPDADQWGIHVDVPMMPGSTQITFLLVNGTSGAQSGNMSATFGSLAKAGTELWVQDGDTKVYTAEPAIQRLVLSMAQAVWLTPDTIVWPGATGSTFKLLTAAKGGIAATATGVSGATTFDLTATTGLSTALQAQFPQYATLPGLTVPSGVDVQTVLQGQVAVASFDSGGNLVEGTSLQIAPVLDAVYAAAAAPKTLGLSFAGDVPTFALWAPTAQAVTLNIYPSASSSSATNYAMTEDLTTGIWSYTAADATWTNSAYYDFNVTVFSRAANNAVVTNTVTDPYSVSLSANATHSMVVNLADAATAPQGWPGTLIPTSAQPTDAVVYELHLRDFSAFSGTANAGKYLAFTETSAGVNHLAALAAAGLTHVHILPAFDISSIDEVKAHDVTVPASTGAGLEAETFMTTVDGTGNAPQNEDWFNWGYDPRHYGAPAGSYSSDPNNGLARVVEFRTMVQALHALNLRVIMDVVYNHTTSSGQNANSVLDQIVPGYYNRLDGNGNVTNKSCCSDTATENVMMGKLMTDTLVQWADQYKVDGFRFDTMGLQPQPLMVQALAAVNAVAANDGRGYTYFYGEGWGETLPFVTASQANMAGTNIGTFNDRMRDAVRGGGPFDQGTAVVTNQGFISGLGYDPNASNTGVALGGTALANQNLIEVSLAGNLALFPLNGSTTGASLKYGGQAAGYTSSPMENIAYVACHDNETLWDISQYKQPAGTPAADRARAQVVGLSTVLLANGVAFVQAGEDLLRSKSDDGNSYNSGDYFNRIFWDGTGNNWAVGAPLQNTGNNAANLVEEQAALTNVNAVATATDIQGASLAFQDFLKIRKSSSMFHLPDAASIIGNVRFPDQGLGQLPGVILMQVGDGTSPVGDNAFASALTVFNASNTAQTITYPWYAGRNVDLHPAQKSGSDATAASATFTAATGAFTVPARTTAVFVENATNSFTGNFASMNLSGDFNGWGSANAMKLVAPNTWQCSVVLATGTYGYKFQYNGWATSWGDDGLGDGKASTSGGNFSISAATAGTYVFTFNDNTLAYVVLPPVWFPGAPSNLAARPVASSSTALQLTWANAGGASFYNIYRSLDGVTFGAPIATATDGTAGYTDTGLTTGTKYYYEVQAANAMFVSGLSLVASGTPATASGPTSPYTAMFMDGNFSTPQWATGSKQGQMTLIANDTWTVTLAMTTAQAASVQFKFCTDDNWGNNPGATAWTSATTGLTGTATVSVAGSGNITMVLPGAGNYLFTFNDTTLAYSCVAQ